MTTEQQPQDLSIASSHKDMHDVDLEAATETHSEDTKDIVDYEEESTNYSNTPACNRRKWVVIGAIALVPLILIITVVIVGVGSLIFKPSTAVSQRATSSDSGAEYSYSPMMGSSGGLKSLPENVIDLAPQYYDEDGNEIFITWPENLEDYEEGEIFITWPEDLDSEDCDNDDESIALPEHSVDCEEEDEEIFITWPENLEDYEEDEIFITWPEDLDSEDCDNDDEEPIALPEDSVDCEEDDGFFNPWQEDSGDSEEEIFITWPEDLDSEDCDNDDEEPIALPEDSVDCEEEDEIFVTWPEDLEDDSN